MADANHLLREAPSWQRSLANAVRDVRELARLLDLPLDELAEDVLPSPDFPLLVPQGFVARMRKGDPHDPLLLQVLPRRIENSDVDGFVADPLAEHDLARDGVVRKYAGRALIVTTEACPIHCRYCFRRSFPYSAQKAGRENWTACLEELRRGGPASEVILSGGDPLSLSNRRLGALLCGLDEFEELQTIRIHTRFPIMLPERIEDGLLATLAASRKNIVVVIHANHANEIDEDVARALSKLKSVSKALLNQSVLLRGINDDATTLGQLSQRLIECAVTPYYLHQLDPIQGAAHFGVGDDTAREIVDRMRACMPGYLVPRLVREIPDALSKIAIE